MNAHDFVTGLTWAELPEAVRRKVGFLLLDLLAVMVAGRPAPAARIAADYASVARGGYPRPARRWPTASWRTYSTTTTVTG
jgi:2-methylcitrate dehydratase PrpD